MKKFIQRITEKFINWYIISLIKDFKSTDRLLLGMCVLYYANLIQGIMLQLIYLIVVSILFTWYFKTGERLHYDLMERDILSNFKMLMKKKR